ARGRGGRALRAGARRGDPRTADLAARADLPRPRRTHLRRTRRRVERSAAPRRARRADLVPARAGRSGGRAPEGGAGEPDRACRARALLVAPRLSGGRRLLPGVLLLLRLLPTRREEDDVLPRQAVAILDGLEAVRGELLLHLRLAHLVQELKRD